MPKLPASLEARLATLREDKHARYELEQRVALYEIEKHEANQARALHRPRRQRHGGAARRALERRHAPAAPALTPSPEATPSPADDADSSPPQASPRLPPMTERPRPPPPLPSAASMPWAADVVERARGDRTRDPVELQQGSGSFVRRREKGLELGGNFRFASHSDNERQASLVEKGGSSRQTVEGPVQSRGEGFHSPRPGANPALWKGGNFVHTKIPSAVTADAALLHGHRLPFIDASVREQLALRHRDRSAELGARPPKPSRLSPRRTSPPPRAPRAEISYGEMEIDELEMATARLMLSTNLSIYRKHSTTVRNRPTQPAFIV